MIIKKLFALYLKNVDRKSMFWRCTFIMGYFTNFSYMGLKLNEEDKKINDDICKEIYNEVE